MGARLAIDTGVLLLYFFGIVALGLWAGRRNKNLRDFSLGGRSIPWWAVLASIVAAETSAATFLGTPTEGFKTRGYFYGQLVIGTILARVFIAFTFIKPYYDYRVQSIYEFLTVRFGTKTKNMASGIFLFTRVLGIGVRLYLGGAIMVVIWRYLFPSLPINLNTYIWGIIFVTVITTIYTAVGGIKAVVWTDLIQAVLMFSSVIFAIFLLLHNIPGGLETVKQNLGGLGNVKMFQTGWNAELPFGPALNAMLEEPYTLFAAFIGSTMLTMATHGTDQDMVQRMLTAPDIRRSRRSLILSGLADIPIVLTFLTIGLLLWVYYQARPDPTLPRTSGETFCHFILYQMPAGLRGLLIAGIFATAMGSLSTAVNALATSFTRDWYEPYINPRSTAEQSLRAVRWATVWFSILMIVVASITSYLVIVHPNVRIIPIVLGIFGYTYGSLLGVFLCGMFTKRRGNNLGNIVAMIVGFIVVAILSGLPNKIASVFGGKFYTQPNWLPVMEFPWWICFGTIVTFSVAILFRTGADNARPARTE
jgi:SSS family solute:Na+ symporter